MLGDELRQVRERRGLSAREVARQAGISVETLSAWERGRRYPSLQSLEALAPVLRIRVVIGPDETFVETVD
jgi:transcriptional regulator with XRE-family HTH domain